MKPNGRMKTSLPPYYFAVQLVGVLALALGLISLFTNLRSAVIGIVPWLGIAWVAWFAGTVSISERPASVEDRAVPGHWEGDLLFGNKSSQIATLVERKTRYVMRVKVDRRDTETVINALIKHAHKLPRELYRSLTWHRGSEMADHHRFTLATNIKVYFCDPYHPWQRGSNENTDGLLRQYFPKASMYRVSPKPNSTPSLES